jgi:hypothetical protein
MVLGHGSQRGDEKEPGGRTHMSCTEICLPSAVQLQETHVQQMIAICGTDDCRMEAPLVMSWFQD